jgi:acetoin utilization protein AcuB
VSLREAKRVMRANSIRHLPVLEHGTLVGIVSERDVQMVEALVRGTPLSDVPCEQAMSQAVYTVSPSTPLQVAARHMAEHRLGSAVVMKGSKVVGVFTTTDALAALADVIDALDERPQKLGALAKSPGTALARRPASALLAMDKVSDKRRPIRH